MHVFRQYVHVEHYDKNKNNVLESHLQPKDIWSRELNQF